MSKPITEYHNVYTDEDLHEQMRELLIKQALNLIALEDAIKQVETDRREVAVLIGLSA